MLSILPRFVALEMIADMSTMDEELLPQQFHKVYIHQYTDVRYGTPVIMYLNKRYRHLKTFTSERPTTRQF